MEIIGHLNQLLEPPVAIGWPLNSGGSVGRFQAWVQWLMIHF